VFRNCWASRSPSLSVAGAACDAWSAGAGLIAGVPADAERARGSQSLLFLPILSVWSRSQPVIGPTSVPVPSPPKACPKVPARTHEPLDPLPVNRPTPHPHGGPVGPRESVEHRFVIGTTLTPFWVRRRPRLQVQIGTHKPSSGCAIAGPTSVAWPAASRWQPEQPHCDAKTLVRAAANKPDSLEPHRRSGRRRTWEHGVAGYHRPHRSAEIWLSSGPMASHQDLKVAGLGEARRP